MLLTLAIALKLFGPPSEFFFSITKSLILQNLLKHAKAKNAFLQILAEENLISIYAEDDGVGFSTDSQTKGIGLKSIEKLVSLLKGRFNIDSTENNGFSISIEFNLMNNEKI